VNKITEKYEKKALLGLVSITPEEFTKLSDDFREMIQHPSRFKIQEKRQLTTMTLIGFNMYHFSGQRFWEELAAYFDVEKVSSFRSECVRNIERFCKVNRLHLYKTNQHTLYRETIQMHSIIAKHQFPKFIQVLFDLYIKDLEEDVSDEIVVELLRHLHKLFTNYQNQDDIESEYRGSKMTVTNQQLPKSFKKAFLLNWNSVARLVKRYFLFFDLMMREDEQLTFKPNNYYDYLFEQHLTEIGTQLEIQKSSPARSGGKKQYKKPFFKLEETYTGAQLYLTIPKQLILPSDIGESIEITFFNDKKMLWKKELDAMPGALFWKTLSSQYHLDAFYPHLTYKITSGNVPIFESKNIMSNNFLLFNSKGDQLLPSKIKKDETYFIITEEGAEVELIGMRSEYSYRKNDYIRYEVIFNEDSEMWIDGVLLSASSKVQPDGFPSTTKYKGARLLSDNKEYAAVKSASYFSFTYPQNSALNKYRFSVNGILLDEQAIANMGEVSALGDGTGRSQCILDFSGFLGQDERILEIEIRRKGDFAPVFEQNYVIINDLEWAFQKEFYVDEASAQICSLESRDLSITLNPHNNHSVDMKAKNYRQSFNLQGRQFWIEVAIPLISIESREDRSKISLDKKYYFESCPLEELIINIPGQVYEMQCSMGNQTKKLNIKRQEDTSSVNVKPYISSRQADVHEFSLRVGNRDYPLFQVYYEEQLEDVDCKYANPNKLMGGLSLTGEYIGSRKLYLEITDEQGQSRKIYDNILLPFYDPSLELAFDVYHVQVYTTSPSFFGDHDEKNILFEDKLIHGDEFILKSRRRIVQSVAAVSNGEKFTTSKLCFSGIGYDPYKEEYKARAYFFYTDRYTGEEKKAYLDQNPIRFKEVIPMNEEFVITPEDAQGDWMVIDTHTGNINPRAADSSHDYQRYKVIENLVIRIL
jgi:hypothetical protein